MQLLAATLVHQDWQEFVGSVTAQPGRAHLTLAPLNLVMISPYTSLP